MLTADELHRRGRAATNAGRLAAARRYLDTALSRVDPGDEDVRARVEVTLAHLETEAGSFEAALAVCERAGARTGLSASTTALVHGQLGMIHMRAGDGDRALEHLARAADGLAADPHQLGVVLLNRGNVHLMRGESARAVVDLGGAAAAFDLAGDAIFRARAQHNEGYASLLAGDLVTALRLMDAARPVLAPLSPVSRAVGEQDRAEVLTAAGMVREADEALTRAARAFGSRRARQHQGEAELALARLLVRDDPRRARLVARRAARRLAGLGSTGWALRAEAVATTAEVVAGGHGPGLLARAEALADDLSAHGLRPDAEVLGLQAARAALAGGDLDGARSRVDRVRAGARTPLPTRLLAREVRAEVATAAGRPADARRHLRAGLRDLGAWQATFGGLDLQTSVVGHGRRLAQHGLRLAVADGRPDVVLEWSERARSLATRVAPLRPPADLDGAADLATLRASRRSGVALTDEAALVDRIRGRAWADPGSGQVDEPLGLDEVRAVLGDADGTLVVHVVVDDAVHALVVTATRDRVVHLGDAGPVHRLLEGLRADLDVVAAHATGPLAAVVAASLDERLAALAERLVSPVADLLADGPVVLTPSGALAGVPWSMLPGLVGRTSTVAGSASVFVRQHRTARPPRSAAFVGGPHVPRAAEEVTAAARAWPGAAVVLGDDATAARTGALATTADVLHVAAHGRHSSDHPLFSGLELADGPWFGHDVDRLPAVPDVVVLSACEVGRSTVRWGEELVGMTAAWLHAGARCVVASPAEVADDVACEVLGSMHASMARGTTPAAALAAASARVGGTSFQCFGSGW
ncbi:CHAT domain-containing protein [Solicola sp. PLA-1-18]|uniref:CHAT domain-containing protein n=1 Tax=Solicola sp. PLA-1-18 TaxID=3380532 RepID=UPI003B7DE092